MILGSTAQFGKKSQTEFLSQFKVWKTKEYCMYFSFFKLKKWGKKAAETRRRNCAVLPLQPASPYMLSFRRTIQPGDSHTTMPAFRYRAQPPKAAFGAELCVLSAVSGQDVRAADCDPFVKKALRRTGEPFREGKYYIRGSMPRTG